MMYAAVASTVPFLAACSPSSRQQEVTEVTVNGNIRAEKGVLPAFESVDTIVPVCPDDVIIPSVGRVYMADGMMVIVDKSPSPQVYGFTAKGEYRCLYGSRGEAPGEYVNMAACAVTPDNEVAIVDSYAQRILFYDLHDGKFKNRMEFPTGSLDMVQQGVSLSDTVMLLARYVYNDKNDVYVAANLENKSVRTFASVPFATDNAGVPVGWNAISAYNGSAIYVKPFEPVIYRYPDIKWITIDQDKKVYSGEELSEIKDFSLISTAKAMYAGYFVGYSEVFDLRDWIFLSFQGQEFALIDKHDWTMTTYEYETDEMKSFTNIKKIIGCVPESNTLIGVDDSPVVEDDRIYLYKLGGK